MSNVTPDLVAPGTILGGRYRVERQLGKGGMGSVYLVQHIHTDQQLALKLVNAAIVSDEVALTRFRREARATARVDSDHVVRVTDADVAPELGGVPFLVMEWLRGQSLEERVAEAGVLPPEEAVLYLRQAARALDKAHAVGIIHRDLKPENLFVTTREDGTPCLKILDFGIAKLTQGADEAGRLKATGTGQIFGTPLYMSPEQIKADLDKICPQSDVWALGIIAHRLLVGTEPWSAPTLTALVAQIAYEPLPVPSNNGSRLGPRFDTWFARCCARETEDRFATAGDAVVALARALGVADEAPPSRLVPDGPRSGSRPARRVDEAASTAFAATSPLSSVAKPKAPSSVEARSPRVATVALGGVLIAAVAGVGAWLFTHREPAVVAPVVAVNPVKDPLLPSATAASSAIPGRSLGSPSTARVEVTPSTTASATAGVAAPPPQLPQPPTATATTARLVVATASRPPSPPPTTNPPPAPTAPVVAPKPEDPLGSRH